MKASNLYLGIVIVRRKKKSEFVVKKKSFAKLLDQKE